MMLPVPPDQGGKLNSSGFMIFFMDHLHCGTSKSSFVQCCTNLVLTVAANTTTPPHSPNRVMGCCSRGRKRAPGQRTGGES